jgi:hypothetical protein
VFLSSCQKNEVLLVDNKVWNLGGFELMNIEGKYIYVGALSHYTSLLTPPRTPRISGLKSQILKPTFLS